MKKINLVLSVFAILFFAACSDVEPLDQSLLSNSGNNSGGNNGGGSGSGGGSGTGGGSSSCAMPINLLAERSALPTNVELSWQPVGTENSWDVQYGVSGFSLGSGTTITVNYFTTIINGLTSSGYDFYVRAKCSPVENSSWFGPVSIAAYSVDNSPAMMTANIDGTQYDHMQPYLYSFTGNDVIVQNNGAAAGVNRYLWIQGDTSDVIGSQFEINLHIPEDKWIPGTYDLYETYDLTGPSFCQASLILPYLASGAPDYQSVTAGSITITEFNLSTKRIKGTFNITYTKSSNNQDYYITNGTFNYGLDHSYFD